ncbi:MAG: hypothetical protein A2W26_05585 [Acidobacteria bacterium RBG_16_64_8]|nr:MAG: hypothetical protein A2W26_05585 [Acidobacteria bacterium RBG_16_64_8]
MPFDPSDPSHRFRLARDSEPEDPALPPDEEPDPESPEGDDEIVELEYADAIGPTLAHAIRNALEILGATEDEVEVEILQEGHRALLGFGKAIPYRVRVSWREDLDEEVIEEEISEEETAELAAHQTAEPRSIRPPQPRDRERVAIGIQPESTSSAESDFRRAISPPSSDLAIRARDATRQLLHQMGFEARVEAELTGDELLVRVRADEQEEGLLIGHRGETRSALQHLVHRLVVPRTETALVVLVDVNGIWQQRIDQLREEAREIAERVAQTGHVLRTPPLPPEERRIVHRALADDTRVETGSEGEGLLKRVAVRPRRER